MEVGGLFDDQAEDEDEWDELENQIDDEDELVEAEELD